MSSVNKEILYEELKNIRCGKIQFYLYERVMNRSVVKNYSSWILCCGINSSDVLEKEWENIVDCFAIHFQTILPSEIERSNLYIVFFIENQISNQLRMSIEYDRYSSRKIVINQKYPESDSDKEKIIENLIFSINEYPESVTTKMLGSWLEDKEPILNELYRKFTSGIVDIEDAFSEYSNNIGGIYGGKETN